LTPPEPESAPLPGVMLIAIYLRVSTEDQARRGHSLPEQRQACLAKARELGALEERDRGHPVHLQSAEFADSAGGDILERPELERLRAFVRQHRPSYLVCLDPDRFSRATYQAILVANEIEAAGTRLEFVQHDYQTTPEGRLFFTLRVAIAEYEKAKILERTARGRRGKINSGGLPTGLNMFGYTYDRDTDEVTPHRDEAPWVVQIFQWAAAGLGCQRIATRLNAAGVPTKRGGARWYRGTVSKILDNSGYIGEIRANRYDCTGLGQLRNLPRERRNPAKKPLTPRQRAPDEWVIVRIPPLIPRELWDTVRALRTGAQTRRAQHGAGLLSGVITCGRCGAAMHYLPRPYGYILRCANRYPEGRDMKHTPPKCDMPHLRAGPIDDLAWARITEAFMDPDVIRRYHEERKSSTVPDDSRGLLVAELDLLQRRLQEQQRAQARLLAVVATGAVDPEVAAAQLQPYKEQAQQLRSELERLENRIKNIDHAETGRERRIERLQEARNQYAEIGITQVDFRRRLERLLPAQRQELVRMLVSEVLVVGQGACDVAWATDSDTV
jgi:site-specific DNA recombinase